MPAKRAVTFRLDNELIDALQTVKEQHGIAITEQVTRALEMFLETMGVSIRRVSGDRSMRLIERLTGMGQIDEEHGAAVGQGQYDLSIWQEIHHVSTLGGTSTVEGLKEVRGSIDLGKKVSRPLVGKNLVLHLEDGRTFPFFFSDASGTFAARGNLQ